MEYALNPTVEPYSVLEGSFDTTLHRLEASSVIQTCFWKDNIILLDPDSPHLVNNCGILF